MTDTSLSPGCSFPSPVIKIKSCRVGRYHNLQISSFHQDKRFTFTCCRADQVKHNSVISLLPALLGSREAATAYIVPPAGQPVVLQAPPPHSPNFVACCYTLEIYNKIYSVVTIIDLCLLDKECVSSALNAHLLPLC